MKNMRRLIIVMTLAVMAMIIMTGAAFAEGEPELSDDGFYEITDAEQLGWFRDKVNAGETDINARIMNDIDMTGITAWTAIGSSQFYGTIDGNGKALKNVEWNFTSQNSGLVGYNYGVIKNLTIEGAINCTARRCAAFSAYNMSIISGCVNKATMTTTYNYMAPIAAYNMAAGSIVYCANLGNVNGSSGTIAGIAAYQYGTIYSCYNTGNIQGAGYAAGIGGECQSTSTCKNSYSTGTVTGGTIGKLFAALYSNIDLKNNYSLSSDGTPVAGYVADASVITEDAVFEVSSIVPSDLGDAFEADTNNINNGYPVLKHQNSKIYPDIESSDSLQIVAIQEFDGGGITSDALVTVKIDKSFAYLKIDRSWFSVSYKIEGQEQATPVSLKGTASVDGDQVTLRFNTLAEFMDKEEKPIEISVALNQDEPFTQSFTLGKTKRWSVYADQPEMIPVGDTERPQFAGYYKITSPEELAWFAGLVNGTLEGVEQNQKAKAFLDTDIELNGEDAENWQDWDKDTTSVQVWDQGIGSYAAPFKGTFDGNFHTISGLFAIYTDSYSADYHYPSVALLPYADNAEIRNLGVDKSYIYNTGQFARAGGIAGTTTDTVIANCWFNGCVESRIGIAGGIVALPEYSTVEACFNAGEVIGDQGAGIVGECWGTTIENCYNVGTPNTHGIGSGTSSATIYSCYSTGSKPFASSNKSVNRSFYLEGAPDSGYGAGCVALSEEQFKDGTLLDGLDQDAFCADEEGENAKNNGYPILAWQTDLYKLKQAAITEIKYFLDPTEYGLSREELNATLESAYNSIEEATSAADVDAVKAAALEILGQFEKDSVKEGMYNEALEELQKELDALDAKINLLGATVTVAEEKLTADGNEQKPAVTVTGKDGAIMEEGKDYTVTYQDNVKPGIATVTVTGTSETDPVVKTATFKILPKKMGAPKLKAAKKKLTVTWKKDADVTGYEIQYSLKKNFKGAKTAKVTKAATSKKVIKKLASKKTYYVRIRSYKTAGKASLYGAWSAAKKAKVK